jgi:hypothetical protein
MQVIPRETSINPVQFRNIKAAYEALTSAAWFNDTEETRQDLSDLIMRQYRKGYTDTSALLAVCEAVARERYSRP